MICMPDHFIIIVALSLSLSLCMRKVYFRDFSVFSLCMEFYGFVRVNVYVFGICMT